VNTPSVFSLRQFAFFGKPYIFKLAGLNLKPDLGAKLKVTLSGDNSKWRPSVFLSSQDEELEIADDGTWIHFVSTPIFGGAEGEGGVIVELTYDDGSGSPSVYDFAFGFTFVSV
jgi:hypothetical protein